MADKPINTIWASDTDNTLTFTESEKALGIEYRGAIVSNQLNGVGQWITEAVQWLQKSGGYYSDSKNYIVNDIVKIIRYSPTQSPILETYRCIAVGSSLQYIVGVPPILGYEKIQETSENVPIYYGGRVNTDYWEKVSQDYGLNNISQEITSATASTSIYRILRFNPPASISEDGADYKATLKFTLINNQGNLTSFTAEVSARLTNYNDTLYTSKNGFGQDNFDVKISKVLSDVTSDLFTSHKDDLMPYGARLELGYTLEASGSTASNVYGLFLKPASDLSLFRVEILNNHGLTLESTYYVDSQDDSSATGYYTTDLTLPIVNGVSTTIKQEVGTINDYLTSFSDELLFKKGLVYSGEGGLTLSGKTLRLYSILSKSLDNVTSFSDLRFTMSVSQPDGLTTNDATIPSTATAGDLYQSEFTGIDGLESDTYENYQLNRLITKRYIRAY